MKTTILLLAFITFQPIAYAQQAPGQTQQAPRQHDFYIGGGIGRNSVDSFDNATGFQIFGAMSLPFDWAGAKHSVEVGYMDSGDFERTRTNPSGFSFTIEDSASGIWGTYNLSWPVSNTISLMVRGGLDAGDDDGLMLGAGVEFNVASRYALRVEAVQRDNIDSIQLNLVYAL